MAHVEHPTVWQLMAAFASDEYELREVACGEFELVAKATPSDEGAGHEHLGGDARDTVAPDTIPVRHES